MDGVADELDQQGVNPVGPLLGKVCIGHRAVARRHMSDLATTCR